MNKTAFEILRNHYGNHSRVAEELGITPRQYRAIRNQGKGSGPVLRLIRELSAKIEQAAEMTA